MELTGAPLGRASTYSCSLVEYLCEHPCVIAGSCSVARASAPWVWRRTEAPGEGGVDALEWPGRAGGREMCLRGDHTPARLCLRLSA